MHKHYHYTESSFSSLDISSTSVSDNFSRLFSFSCSIIGDLDLLNESLLFELSRLELDLE